MVGTFNLGSWNGHRLQVDHMKLNLTDDDQYHGVEGFVQLHSTSTVFVLQVLKLAMFLVDLRLGGLVLLKVLCQISCIRVCAWDRELHKRMYIGCTFTLQGEYEFLSTGFRFAQFCKHELLFFENRWHPGAQQLQGHKSAVAWNLTQRL